MICGRTQRSHVHKSKSKSKWKKENTNQFESNGNSRIVQNQFDDTTNPINAVDTRRNIDCVEKVRGTGRVVVWEDPICMSSNEDAHNQNVPENPRHEGRVPLSENSLDVKLSCKRARVETKKMNAVNGKKIENQSFSTENADDSKCAAINENAKVKQQALQKLINIFVHNLKQQNLNKNQFACRLSGFYDQNISEARKHRNVLQKFKDIYNTAIFEKFNSPFVFERIDLHSLHSDWAVQKLSIIISEVRKLRKSPDSVIQVITGKQKHFVRENQKSLREVCENFFKGRSDVSIKRHSVNEGVIFITVHSN